jgi:gluconolactonase
MSVNIRMAIVCCLIASVLSFGPDAAQRLLPGEREAIVQPIPGVIAAGAKWELAWSGFDNADGIVGTPDGGLLFAQEQPSRVRKLDADGRDSIFLENTHGAGSLSMDAQGRILAVQRTEPTMIGVLAPAHKVLAKSFQDGKPLGRLNDLVADKKGGAYFTVGGAYYVNRDGLVTTVADDIRSNGIMLSPDERTLYVTNGPMILAFDVQPDGSVRNRRDFGRLQGDGSGDGMAVDAGGRLYVTAGYTVQVFSPQGQHLGVIPTPRQVITAAFTGPGKKTLFVVGHGAVGADGVEKTDRPAKTLYKISMLAEGFSGRAK